MSVTQKTHNVPDSPLLTVNDLSVELSNTIIVHSIKFSLFSGTVTGLVGPNGCGKTTLLRAVCGYLPYTGSILFEQKEICIWSQKELARKISFVRQAPRLSFEFTVEELVLLGLLPRKSLLEGVSRHDQSTLKIVLEQVGLSGFEKRSLQSLSGGERQRAYLAQAIMQDSELLLLDEPTTHLDVCHQYQFLELMKGLKNQGKTVLAVFHDLELAAKFSDFLLVLHHGHLVVTGTPKHILRDELLANVFRMRGRVGIAPNGECKITYDAPLTS